MIRARVQRKGKEYTLGEFATQKEVDAAKAAAARVLARVEADTPLPIKAKMPSLPIIVQMLEMGRYDSHPDGLHAAALAFARRFNMLKEGRNAATPASQKVSVEYFDRLLAIG
jgi:hypothetical protein